MKSPYHAMYWRVKKSILPDAFQTYKPRHMKVYGSIIVNNKGEVLLVYGRLSKKWSFPKGHCKNGESDLDCATRELFEETGLVINSTHTSYHKMKGGSYFVFAVTGRPFTSCNDNREIERVQWWHINEISHLNTNVDVSIFRTLMRGIPDETVCSYMESDESRQRASIIINSM